jgi:hypothetical protein
MIRHGWILLTMLFGCPLVAQQHGMKGSTKSAINCKTCHTCEYPTVQVPCLIDCPREDLITVRHSAASGPTVIRMDVFKERYGPVIFSHRLHAEMAGMGGGCESCHHYNTTGPVLKCSVCHETADRKELERPGLLAAYHRQCISCHREWSQTVECQSCHPPIHGNTSAADGGRAAVLKTKAHKVAVEPKKRLYDTNYDKGRLVTFYHDQHTQLFGLACTQCHSRQGCIQCHDVNKDASKELVVSSTDARSEDEKHAACFSCHKDDRCSQCHRDSELKPFNHLERSGWAIEPYHAHLRCQHCHGSKARFTRVSSNCNACHSLATSGSFRHQVTGLILDDNHSGLSCDDCHAKNNFMAVPSCGNCHDDKTWPRDRPGRSVR